MFDEPRTNGKHKLVFIVYSFDLTELTISQHTSSTRFHFTVIVNHIISRWSVLQRRAKIPGVLENFWIFSMTDEGFYFYMTKVIRMVMTDKFWVVIYEISNNRVVCYLPNTLPVRGYHKKKTITAGRKRIFVILLLFGCFKFQAFQQSELISKSTHTRITYEITEITVGTMKHTSIVQIWLKSGK